MREASTCDLAAIRRKEHDADRRRHRGLGLHSLAKGLVKDMEISNAAGLHVPSTDIRLVDMSKYGFPAEFLHTCDQTLDIH
jgi:hypothetical protein